jgi:hypothetical protein
MPMIKAIELDLAVAMTAPGDKEGMPLRPTRFVWATADTGCRWPFRALSRRCSARLRLSKDPAKVAPAIRRRFFRCAAGRIVNRGWGLGDRLK